MNRSITLCSLLFFALASLAMDDEEEAEAEALEACEGLLKGVKAGDAKKVKKNLKRLKDYHYTSANCSDANGWTAMHFLARLSSTKNSSYFFEIFTFLRFHGNGRLDAKSDSGMTPLMVAADHGNKDAVCLFIKHHNQTNSIMIDETNNAGNTALHLAVIRNNHQIAKLLLTAGANSSTKDRNQETPKTLAERLEFRNIVAVFDQFSRIVMASPEKGVAIQQ